MAIKIAFRLLREPPPRILPSDLAPAIREQQRRLCRKKSYGKGNYSKDARTCGRSLRASLFSFASLVANLAHHRGIKRKFGGDLSARLLGVPCGGPWGVLHISGTVHLTPRTRPPFNRFMILTSAPLPDVNVNKQLQILYMWDSLSL